MKPNDRVYFGKQFRVIDKDGNQAGILLFEDAQKLARASGLDLVLVAEKSTPPVCRIMDFGKLVYEQKKRIKDQKRQHHQHKLKEIKFKINIDPHDYQIKINHAVDFFQKGYKVKISLMFRGREMAHKEIGFDLIKRITKDLEQHATQEAPPKLLGRNITAIFAPAKGLGSGRRDSV